MVLRLKKKLMICARNVPGVQESVGNNENLNDFGTTVI
jgi:hypothetical protein